MNRFDSQGNNRANVLPHSEGFLLSLREQNLMAQQIELNVVVSP